VEVYVQGWYLQDKTDLQLVTLNNLPLPAQKLRHVPITTDIPPRKPRPPFMRQITNGISTYLWGVNQNFTDNISVFAAWEVTGQMGEVTGQMGTYWDA
jgi:hypothetical protein